MVDTKPEYKMVAIGGGTGNSQIARYLHQDEHGDLRPIDLTFIVTPTDDGGLTQIYRRDYGALSTGDFTNVGMELSGLSEYSKKAFSYRPDNGRFAGNTARHSLFGNAWAVDPEKAMEITREVFQIPENRGVYLATLESSTLCAEVEDTRTSEIITVKGEGEIDKIGKNENLRVKKVFLKPRPKAYPPAVEAILQADICIIAPGSLYTSLLPNLEIDEIRNAFSKSNGLRGYICNIMTEPGSTDGYTVSKHVEVILEHVPLDFVLVNTGDLSEHEKEVYKLERKFPVKYDKERTRSLVSRVIEGNFLLSDGLPARHGPQTAEVLMNLLYERD